MNLKSFLFSLMGPPLMKPKAARSEFEEHVKKAGLQIKQLTLEDGIRLMFEFYKDVRAHKCRLDGDGDMLLFEWGTYSFLKPRRFQLSLTRQFMRPGGEDEDISQLRLIFRFDPTPESEALADANQWCRDLDGLPEFERFVRESEPFRIYGNRRPDEIVYYYQDGV